MTIELKQDNILKLRMDTATLALLERARAYVNLDKSKFIRQSITEKAQAVIVSHEQTRFTQEDWYLFFELLENTPEPTERMNRAAQKYLEITSPDGV